MSNARVPAAAGGLSTRRGALATLAGIGAAVALPAAAQTATATAGPALARLTARYAAAHARAVAALKALNLAECRIVNPEAPEALYGRPDDPPFFRHGCGRTLADGRRWHGDEDAIARLRAWKAGDPLWWPSDAVERRNEILAAYDVWEVAIRAAEDAAGFRSADVEYAAADRTLDAIRAEVVQLRSGDPAVLQLKLRVLADLMERPAYLDNAIAAELETNGPTDSAIALSLARDLGTFPVTA